MSLLYYKIFFTSYIAIYFVIYYIVISFDLLHLSDYSDIIELFGIIASFPAFAVCIYNHHKGERAPWIWFAITALLFFIGDSLWAYIVHTTGEEPETPSICDIFYIANTITCLIGLAIYVLKNENIDITNLSIDIIISILAAFGIIFLSTIKPILAEENIDYISLYVKIAYPIGDITLLFAFFVLFFNTSEVHFFSKTNILIAFSFLLMFLSDQIYLIDSVLKLNLTMYMEPVWGIIYLILAIAGLCDQGEYVLNASDKEVKHAFRAKIIDNIRTLIPYILTFSVLIYVIVKNNIIDFASIWALLLFTLLCLRQVIIIVRNKRLLAKIQLNEVMLNLKNSELEKLNEKIQHDAQIDSLTQLYNRRFIDEVLEELECDKSQKKLFGIMIIDVDLFKKINDKFGHQTGDKVLRAVADCIKAITRTNDIACRFGGDEFIVLLPDATVDAVKLVAQRLIGYIHNNTYLSELHVTLSIGCSSWYIDDKDNKADRLLKIADDALYRAKDRGRDGVVVITNELVEV